MILVALNFAMTLITDRFTLNITTTCQQPFPSYDHFKNDSNEFESITNLEKNEDFKHTCQLLNPLSPAYICWQFCHVTIYEDFQVFFRLEIGRWKCNNCM